MDLIPRVRVNPPSVALQIIAAQEEMLRKERELDEARKKLAQIRQQQYKFLPSELREDHS
jgi:talin